MIYVRSKMLGFLLLLAMVVPPSFADEDNNGELGRFSSGKSEITFEISDSVLAGFLQTNLDDPKSEFRTFLSTKLIKQLKQDMSTSLPFCVISNSEGYYEISSYEVPGQSGNRLQSEFGSSLPFQVAIGDRDTAIAKYKAVPEICDASSAVYVNITLNRAISGNEIGNLVGKFNLIVKSE